MSVISAEMILWLVDEERLDTCSGSAQTEKDEHISVA